MSKKELTAENAEGAEGAEIVLTKEQRQRVDRAKAYHAGCIGGFKEQMTYAFLAGLELNGIKDELPHGSFERIAEIEFPEIPKRTRCRYMAFELAFLAALPESRKSATVALLVEAPKKGKIGDGAKEAVAEIIHKVSDGKSLTAMYRDLGVIRDPKPAGGMRPDAKAVQAWLKEFHVELVGTKFDELPKDLQRAFLKHYRRQTGEGGVEKANWMELLDLERRAAEANDGAFYKCALGENPAADLERIEKVFFDLYTNVKTFRKEIEGKAKRK